MSASTACRSAIRQTQPFGAAPLPRRATRASCCRSISAPRRQLRDRGRPHAQPEQPLCAAFAADPAKRRGAHLLSVRRHPAGSDRTNEVYRFTGGLNGSFGGDWNWRSTRVYARDNLSITQHGLINIAALRKAINTGSYNFVNPSLNSAAVRARSWRRTRPRRLSPKCTRSTRRSPSAAHCLGGGPLQVAVGGQVRREKLENNNQNVALDTYGLTTASAFGQHTVSAAISNSMRRSSTRSMSTCRAATIIIRKASATSRPRSA
jgi:iron complex outermembrane receptor protein